LKWDFKFESKPGIQRIGKTLHCFAGRKPPIQPIPAFGPSAGPSNRPTTATYRSRHRVTGKRVPRPASPGPYDDARASSLTFGLWLTPKGKGGRAGRRAHRRGVPRAPRRISSVRVSHHRAALLKPPPSPRREFQPKPPWGKSLPCPPTNPPEEKEK
jgi:hypothetical protein